MELIKGGMKKAVCFCAPLTLLVVMNCLCAIPDACAEEALLPLLPSDSKLGKSNPCPKVENKEKIQLKIVHPLPNKQFYFAGGKLEFTVAAKVTPKEYTNRIEWHIDEIEEKPTVWPPNGPGGRYLFNKMPRENNSFGKKVITAEIPGIARDQVTIEVFFTPEETTHPGKGSGKTPNWFYYWLQTSAKDSSISDNNVIYERTCRRDNSHFNGFEDQEDDKNIYYCDKDHFEVKNEILGVTTNGIDSFAVVIIHELEHKKHYDEWWEEFYERIRNDPKIWDEEKGKWRPDPYFHEIDKIDANNNKIPDNEDERLTKERLKYPCNGCLKGGLEEDLCWIAMRRWVLGSADKEDWSMCGKQWKEREGCPNQ